MMRHPGREYGVVLEGRLGVRLRFEEYALGPGDSIAFDSTQPHRLWNLESCPSSGSGSSSVATADAIWVGRGCTRPTRSRPERPRVQRSGGMGSREVEVHRQVTEDAYLLPHGGAGVRPAARLRVEPFSGEEPVLDRLQERVVAERLVRDVVCLRPRVIGRLGTRRPQPFSSTTGGSTWS